MTIQDGVLLQITSYESKGDLVIPNSVTRIGMYAFYGCSGLTSVTIPNSVMSIGREAFSGCSGLTSVTIGNGVTSIEYNTLAYCSSLTSITIPDSVTSIGCMVFEGCCGLTSVTIGNGVTSIGHNAFSACEGLKSKVANYKAFKITPSGKLKCRNKIYREGYKSYTKGDLKICKNGIHYCTNLFEVFRYYWGKLDEDIAIYECDVSDENIGEEGTSKRCARWIIPRKRLYREDVIRILNGGE